MRKVKLDWRKAGALYMTLQRGPIASQRGAGGYNTQELAKVMPIMEKIEKFGTTIEEGIGFEIKQGTTVAFDLKESEWNFVKRILSETGGWPANQTGRDILAVKELWEECQHIDDPKEDKDKK